MNPIALIAVIIIGGLWASVALAIIAWALHGIYIALSKPLFDWEEPRTKNQEPARSAQGEP